MHRNRRALALFSATAMGGTALVGLSVASPASAAPAATNFALSANGWSTNVVGGALPATSGPTGFALIACTRLAPRASSNDTAALRVPAGRPLVRVGATDTRVTTARTQSRVSSNSVNNVAGVVVGNKATAALQINGIQTVGRAWHDGSGYHNREVVTVARVTRYVNGNPSPVASIPTNQDLSGQSLRVPGVATVTFGSQSGSVNTRSASARVTGLRIDLTVSRTSFFVGRANARIDGGAVAGIMGGVAWGSRLDGLRGVANSGSTAAIFLPCMGTNGQWRNRHLARVRIPGVATIGGLDTGVLGRRGSDRAAARGRSTIARAVFGDRNLVIRGIRATGHVTRTRNGTVTRAATTRVLGIRVGGRTFRVPRPGQTLTIPRVARIQTKVVTRTPNGFSVAAVRVQLLQGSRVESTLRLGNVRLNIRRA
jgi:hypothetical protein